MPITSIIPRMISVLKNPASAVPMVISELGNPLSLVPITIKDTVSCSSLTYHANNHGGKIEAIDKATDEFGTEAIWIGGIPLFKKIIDKTVYKLAKISPDVDARIIRHKEYAEWAKENAKGFIDKKAGKTVAEAIEDCILHSGKTKALYFGKVAIATALTAGTYLLLTKFRQKSTKERAEKEKLAEAEKLKKNEKLQKQEQQSSLDEHEKNVSSNPVFQAIGKKQLSFKGLGQNLVDGLLFNPVHNMKLIDVTITGERLGTKRNDTEFGEFLIKEGAFFCFMYFLGNILQDGFAKVSEFFGKPIGLDIKALMSDEVKNALSSNKIVNDIKEFKNALPEEKTKEELSKLSKEARIAHENNGFMKTLDFIIENPDNIAVKTAKKSGVIGTLKNGIDVDTSKFISGKDFKKVVQDLEKLDTHFKSSGLAVEKFLKRLKGLKVGSVGFNMLTSCLVFAVAVPKLMYGYRKKKNGTTKFHVVEDIKNGKVTA